MTNPQIDTFEKVIREKLPSHGDVAKAAEAIKTDAAIYGTIFSPEMERNLSLALERVIASLGNVEILRKNSLIKPKEDWYTGPSAFDRHWPALKGYLANVKGWDKDTVDSMDSSSSEVVSLLANPKAESFRHRGLVVGYVQSGKTANMTAVIAKAVDAGYNLIVLLAGVTNKLRAQTQRRIETDIVERHGHLWQLYTEDKDNGDFVIPKNRQFTLPVDGGAQLVVMKKIPSRLEAFRKTIKNGRNGTSTHILRHLKVLIIDDECDQASVNSATNDDEITRINEEIRKIIRALPAVSYVGYTATPFANVFIDPYPRNDDALDDLYPEDFITALPRSKNYFGAREVFGFEPEDADNETAIEAGRDMIRVIPDGKLDALRPVRASDKSFQPRMTEELENALLWFLISCAIRRARGQASNHMSMLIHTSPLIAQHEGMEKIIKNWLTTHKADLAKGTGEIYIKAHTVFDLETSSVPLEDKAMAITFGDLAPQLQAALEAIEVAIENGESDTRLDFTNGPKTYIVIGGAVLARGLTIEGLSVSFFLRTSMQYDTLLQMGRWFGYRPGYEDLPRLWTTAELASSFRALARIEEEIRADIDIYREHKLTPAEFAMRVRAIPGMAITAASKMRHAYRTSISFEGRHVQTIRFDHKNGQIVSNNWAAAVQLANDIAGKLDLPDSPKRRLARNVDLSVVRKFLKVYNICDQHMDLKKELLLGYIEKASDALQHWNVGFITPGERPSAKPLGALGYVSTNRRTQLTPGQQNFADIKALMSRRDILIDANQDQIYDQEEESWTAYKRRRPETPLLLLYIIDKESPLKSASENRMALNAVDDIVGMAIVFPGTPDKAGNYYSVELDAPVADKDEEELQELIKAGEVKASDE
jgi:hypothetical protein